MPFKLTYKSTDIPVPNATASSAFDINNKGQVLGMSQFFQDRSAFLYTSGKLTTVSGGDAGDVNANGNFLLCAPQLWREN